MTPNYSLVNSRPKPRPSQNRASGQLRKPPLKAEGPSDSSAFNFRRSADSPESKQSDVGAPVIVRKASRRLHDDASQSWSSAGDSTSDGLVERPRVPKKVDDWDAMKPMIEELYLNNNVRLKDVIEIMQSLYKFRATPRMYKAQFAKWNWHKYQTSTHDGRGPRGGRSRATMVGRKGTASSLALDLVRPNLFRDVIENDESRQLSQTISTHRTVIHGWTELDPRWDPEKSFVKMAHYDTTCGSHFIIALELLHKKEYREGGRLLRAGFLGLENLILDNHLAGIWDMCITIPLLAHNYGHKDIALTYARYVAALAAAKMPNHPLVRIMQSLVHLAESNFDIVDHYARSAWQAWTDTLISKLGTDNIHPLHTTRAYLFTQNQPDPHVVAKLIADFKDLVAKSIAKHGPHSTDALDLEYDAIRTEMRFDTTGVDFEEPLLSLLSRLSTKKENKDMPPVTWCAEDRHIYRGCLRLLCNFYERQGDEERLATFLRLFIASPADGDWVQLASLLEDMLRQKGRIVQAEEVFAARTEFQLSPDIVKFLEEEERQNVGIVFDEK